MQLGKFNTVVDSAWGSSGKGAAATRLVDIHGVQNASSGNYPNAGHTAIVNDVKFVAKALPTPAILKVAKGSNVNLWLGPNSGFQLPQLYKEMEQTGYNIGDDDVFIHSRAMIVRQRHIDAEQPTGTLSTEHVSSTMSGSGSSYAEKLMRRPEVEVAGMMEELQPTLEPMDFMKQVRFRMRVGETFLHEVSQGFALSVNYGTHYPFCTFRDCTPQQAYADFGLLPEHVGDVYLNIRSFPIRVGNNYRDGQQTGYSGDVLPDQEEITWAEVAAGCEMPEDVAAQLAEAERTTVTKKIRRVFTFSDQLLHDSAKFTGAAHISLNFLQYIHWSAFKIRGGYEVIPTLHPKVRAFIEHVEDVACLPVTLIGTGPDHEDYIYLD